MLAVGASLVNEWNTLTGVLVVKNQAHLVHLPLLSSMGVCDDYLVIDNMSDDRTAEVVDRVAAAHDLDVDLRRCSGYAGRLFLDALGECDEYAMRLEGDQCYYRPRVAAMRAEARPGTSLNARAWMVRGYLELMNRAHPRNAPHPIVYYCDGSNRMIDGKLWPRSPHHQPITYGPTPISVNVKVMPPAQRVKRYHRACWWRWGDRDIPEHMRLDEYDMPYQESLSLTEYIWRLRERGKGSATTEWGQGDFDTLTALGEALIDWDTRRNCSFFPAPYPDYLEADIRAGRFDRYLLGCPGAVYPPSHSPYLLD